MNKEAIPVSLTDYHLLLSSLLNKGTAFTEEEREVFMLHGLLPPQIATIEEQRVRAYNSFKMHTTSLEKYLNLRSLQDSNETLFYHLLTNHIEELMPYVYTPVVGEGCIKFSHTYRRPRGIFISYPNRDRIEKILSNSRFDQVEVIVVSDGERILGLGDQGAGGMGIPIGKLCLYTACAGIHPRATLPILLDVGTDNQTLLDDPLYIGWRHERIRGKEYDDFIEKFVTAVKKRFPHVLLQWEDFAKRNAGPLLERYQNQLCTFNDDIQGTAAVTVGTLLSAIKVTHTSLKEQKIVVVGAGSAGCGISRLIRQAMIEEGLPKEEASKRFFLIDSGGLLLEDTPDLKPFQKEFAQSKSILSSWERQIENKVTLKDVIKNVKPTLLIGVSGQPGIFTEDIVREMANHVKRPIIFPLSNPTSRSEAAPSDLMEWTEGRAVIGTGSPFDPIEKNGKFFTVDQTNNAYIFPGMGLGIVAVNAKHVTNSMFMVAARTLADTSPAKQDPEANLLPPLKEIRNVSYKIALAVAKEAAGLGLCDPLDDKEIQKRIEEKIWVPEYRPYKKA